MICSLYQSFMKSLSSSIYIKYKKHFSVKGCCCMYMYVGHCIENSFYNQTLLLMIIYYIYYVDICISLSLTFAGCQYVVFIDEKKLCVFCSARVCSNATSGKTVNVLSFMLSALFYAVTYSCI